MKKLLVVLVLLLGLLAVIAAAVILITPRVTRFDPIKIAGDALTGYGANSDRHRNAQQLPKPWDPVGDANRRVEAIPIEDRAYPLIAEAAAMLEAADVGELLSNRVGDDGWEETVVWVESDEAQSIIGVLQKAAAKLEGGFPLSDGSDPIWEGARERHGLAPNAEVGSTQPMLVSVLLPHVGASRRAIEVLLVDAEFARQSQDPERHINNLLLAIRLSEFQTEIPSLIEYMVRYANLARIVAAVEDLILETPYILGQSHATSLSSELDRLARAGFLKLDLSHEDIMTEDILRRFLDANGVFDSASARRAVDLDSVGGTSPTPSSVDTASINQDVMDAIILAKTWSAEAERRSVPPFRADTSIDAQLNDYIAEASGLPGTLTRLLFGILLPSYDRVVSTARFTDQHISGFRLALAAHRHWLRHGDPPLGLADIDDDLITFHPIDGFTGGPMQFRWRDGAPFVYTYGPDKDDDGGRHVLDEGGEPWVGISDELLESAPDGDFVLFPAQTP